MYKPTNPFPFALKSTAIVTDERCTCGEVRSKHSNTLAYGHGEIAGKCRRYTWLTFVFTTSGMPAGFQALDDKHAVKIERASTRNVGAKGWRYEVRDMSKIYGGAKLFSTATTTGTKAQALEHARIELDRFIKRQQPTLSGVS